MKKLFYILILFPLLLASCFEDDSNTDIRDINPIVIDLSGGNQLRVKQMDTLKVDPLVYCNGVPDSRLAFEWKLMNYGVTVPRVIDTNMYCCAQITEPAASNYTLRLTVTDKTTGIFRIQTYNLTVETNFAEGILIADTKDGGAHSDLNLIMSREVSRSRSNTMDDESRDVYYELWKNVNGHSLEGKVLTAMTAYSYKQFYPVTVVTEKNVYEADFKTYVQTGIGNDMFYPPPYFSGEPIVSAFSHFVTNGLVEHIMVNGRYYSTNLQNDMKFLDEATVVNNPDYNITLAYMPYNSWTQYPVYGYDATNRRMLFFRNSFGSFGYQLDEQTNTSGKFNVNDLSDYDILYLGQCMEGMTLLAKDKSGNYKALVMNLVAGNVIASETKIAKAVYALGSPAGFAEAKYYAMGAKGNALYYATENEVYAGPIDNFGTAKAQWTPEPGEPITGMEMYRWPGGKHEYEDQANGNKAQQDSEARLLFVFTRTGTGEGKVTAIPVTHTNIGTLEQNRKFHVVFGGFGDILGLYKQYTY